MKEKKVKVIIKESSNDSQTPNKIANETGATPLILSQDVSQTEEGSNYILMMERNIQGLENALSQKQTV